MQAKVLTTDKREIQTDLAAAYVNALSREAAFFVAIIEASEPLVGVEAMEALGISIDPATGEIKPCDHMAYCYKLNLKLVMAVK